MSWSAWGDYSTRSISVRTAADAALEPLSPYSADVRKKQQVTWTSLRKVEDGTSTPHTAAYTLRVRSAEYATNVPMMQEMVRRALMSGSEEA